MPKNDFEFNEKIHAIIINPYLSWEYFKKKMNNHKVNINALISYPFSDLPKTFIKEFISYASDLGANGVEYVPNFLNLSKNDQNSFGNDIESIMSSELPVTLVINKNKLQQDLFVKAIEISTELGINNFQFGDGFGPPLSLSEINHILKIVSNKSLIKVVGGIKNINQVVDLLDIGVDSIGTSNFYEIFQDIKKL